jgi:hypothetical protein
MRGNSFSLCFLLNSFESVKPFGAFLPFFSLAATTNKGPAHAPRPTSSIPIILLYYNKKAALYGCFFVVHVCESYLAGASVSL